MKKTIIVLLVIPALLLGMSFGLDSLALKNARNEHIWMLETLLDGGENFVTVEYAGEDSSIRSIHKSDAGYVIEVEVQGYASEITLLCGVTNGGEVTGVVVYRAHETVGLGGRILYDHRFLSQFLNKSGSFVVGKAEDAGDALSSATSDTSATGKEVYIDGISGATVSSKAVARAVSSAVAYVTGADVDSSATEWEG